jgi:hypothetical protein
MIRPFVASIMGLFILSVLILFASFRETTTTTTTTIGNTESKNNSDASTNSKGTREFDRDAVEEAIRNEMRPFAAVHWRKLVQATNRKALQRTPESNCKGARAMRVAVCAIVQYESLYLSEWLAHHRTIGVEHFFLLDDNAADAFERNQTALMVAPFGADVTLFHSEQLGTLVTDDALVAAVGGLSKKQFLWFTHCSRELRTFAGKQFDWIANIDADEFVLPVDADKNWCLQDLLAKQAPATPALMLSRRTFTSSGETDYVDAPVMSRFTKAADTTTVKSIVRPETVLLCASAHQCEYKDGARARNLAGQESGTEKSGRETTNPVFAPAFLAHYRTKSLSECVWKTVRGYGWMESKGFTFCGQSDGVRDASAKPWAKRYEELL